MNDSDDYTVEGVMGWGDDAFSGQAGGAIWRRSAWRPHAVRGSRRIASWRTGAFMGPGVFPLALEAVAALTRSMSP